ncbi:hypothetical protein [Methanospirillum hungatei]|nr:hypothetical protein [Methanospirillum hungatei]
MIPNPKIIESTSPIAAADDIPRVYEWAREFIKIFELIVMSRE